jgi:glycosyltransferase involved in cell wall biosynthesis
LRAQAEQLDLKGVHFLGHQAQTDVAELFNVSDVSTGPSRVEPFGLVAVEALACGTPVVPTNEGGLPDFVDERLGTLVDVGDTPGLAKAIANEIKAATKGPFGSDYALKDF